MPEMDDRLPMKRSLIIITVITCLAIAGLFARTLQQENLAVDQSSALVMMVTTDVLVSWHPEMLRQNASVVLLDRQSADSMQRHYTLLGRRLGALQEIYDIEYQVDIPGWWQPNGTVSASYNMRARFESEVATISVELLRQEGRWLISDYDIQPPAIAS
jgi:hypothetical protein